MSFEVCLPKLSFSMDEGKLTEWYVADGAQVNEGDPLYGVEAEKAAQEVPAPASGTLRISAQPGETYPIGTLLAVIE